MALMSYIGRNESSQWIDQIPVSFNKLKSILSTFTNKDTSKLSSSTSSDFQRQTKVHRKKQDQQVLPRNQTFIDATVNSFLVSSSPSAIRITRQDESEVLSPPKRFISSFKPSVHLTNNKQTQRLNYINDSVMILKLSKEHANNSSLANSQSSSKHLLLSTTNTMISVRTQQPPLPLKLSPILKIQGQKRRIVQHDSPVITSSTADISITENPMATSTSNRLQPNSSVFTYRSTASDGSTVRHRVIAEAPTTSLLLSAERYRSNIASSIRPTRHQSMSTIYSPSQQTQRNTNPNIKSRVQLEKLSHSRDNYAYADPFTNCPQDILSKLAQLTKLQLETIEWEKKKRFTKKKPISNAFIQGKDSP